MGRRTVWWWRAAAAVGAALCGTTAPTGTAVAADAPTPYAYARDAITVEGATSSTGAVRLAAGQTYRSSVGPGGKLYFRLDLGAAANAYVSATAVPEAGSAVGSADGVRVSVQDADAHRCSYETARFGPTRSGHPVTAWASRVIGSDEYMCQEAGVYYVVVERVGSAVGGGTGTSTGSVSGSASGSASGSVSGSASGSVTGSPSKGGAEKWGLELGFVSEPAVTKGGATNAPQTWNSASPEAVSGDPEDRRGGSGFATASPVAQGIWRDEVGIRAGETLFYKVPVGWGQQLHATAELGSTTEGDGYVGNAFVMSLYNPVRGLVDDRTANYGGDQRSVALDPLPPVAYENRFSLDDEVGGMRFAGWYYLALHLGTSVADRFGDDPVGLTLRVRLEGEAGTGPGYLGASVPRGVFEVTDGDREAAENGTTGDTLEDGAGGSGGAEGGADGGSAGRSGDGEGSGGSSGGGDQRLAMTVVAAGGIGTGSLLVLGLLLWTVVARLRASTATESERPRAGTASRGRHGASRGR
ncbi:hypothetical protein [Streptomyces caniscabiei]|uniref:hypothetical protein n=1 Tax=Streptomyces caniscabiei TaxID=2746961 RepID=UPI000A3C02C5|nr:hypothetical protein [Streptomyces caniscabiei]MBD9701621.1 hypothetical protein [Streptomyces caniscabiei]MDX3726316.1 hypothetical protein [Streptomyces caniscabiei]